MTKFRKFAKKVLPRLLAIFMAAVLGTGLYFVSNFVFYTPETGKDDEPEFELQKDPDSLDDEKLTIKASDKIFNFLVMGHDRAASLTDVIMLINYNTEIQRITIMQLPRDTYIEVDDYFYHKVNGLYNYSCMQAKEEGSKNPEADGREKMVKYLEKHLAMKIHFSAVMDLDGFGNIVDAIGGVEMYVPQDMYYVDSAQGLYINLKEGNQHLDGKAAEQFVRYRYGYATGDIGRGDAQKIFISAFLDKLLSSVKDARAIAALAKNLIEYVDTDITIPDIAFFGKNFIGIGNKSGAVELSNVKLMTMPGKATMYGGASYYVMNKEYMSSIINDYYNVYNTSVMWSFDINEVFVTEENSVLRDIYTSPRDSIPLRIYNAGKIEQDGLN